MFTISSVLSTVRKGDFVFKIELQDAYFHVPIHQTSRKYLRFAFENEVYQFRVLPFGLNTAPQIFTRLGHTLTGYLHSLGISVIPYLDDWLFHHSDRQVLLYHQSTEYARPGGLCSEQEVRTGHGTGYSVSWCSVRLDLGRALFPESKDLEKIAHVCEIFSQQILSYQAVAQFVGFTQLDFRSYSSRLFVPEAITTSFPFLRSDEPFFITT